MRAPWMYRLGALLLLFAGGLAIWFDASFSRAWIAEVTGADKVMPGMSTGLAFILAVLASSFGAIATNPVSWRLLYLKSKRLAAITDAHERLLNILGNGVVALIILGGFVFVYGTNIISTQHQVKHFWLAVAIVFGSDLCFMLAVPLWLLSKASSIAIEEFHSTVEGGGRTVNTGARRFGKDG